MFALLHLTLLSPVLSSLHISVSTSSAHSSFLSPASGRLVVKEGTPFYVRCVSGDHFSTNSSIIWDVKTKAWQSSLWMNVTEMGLSEESDYAADKLTSVIYVTKAGAKDVGKYSCIQISNELLDIDGSEAEQSVYIFVRTDSDLTPQETGQMMMVRTEELQLPCIPTHPDILVSLTTNGEDVTDQFQYDPTRGFWPGPRTSTTSTTFTCYFSLAGQTESLSVKVVSREWERPGEEEVVEVTLTSQTKQEEVQLVCKIFTPEDSPVEIVDLYWQLPALGGQQIHKDDIVMIDVRDRFSLEEVKMDFVTVSTLLIDEVDQEDQGVYRCRVETMDGKSFESETFVNIDSLASEEMTVNPSVIGLLDPSPPSSTASPGTLTSVLISVLLLLFNILHQ